MDQKKITTIIFITILVICVGSVVKGFVKKMMLGKVKYEAKVSPINGNLIVGVILTIMIASSVLNQKHYDLSGIIGGIAVSVLAISFLWMGLMKVGIRQGGIIDKQSCWKWSEIKSYSWNEDKVVFICKNRAMNKVFLTQTTLPLKLNDKKEIDKFLNKNICKK